jgi:hypothetical protein
MLHSHLHLNSAVIRRTSGRSLGTFKSSGFSGMGELWVEEHFPFNLSSPGYMHRRFEGRKNLALYGASRSGQFVPGFCCMEDWWTQSDTNM